MLSNREAGEPFKQLLQPRETREVRSPSATYSQRHGARARGRAAAAHPHFGRGDSFAARQWAISRYVQARRGVE